MINRALQSLIIILSIVLINCKTITVQDDFLTFDIPKDIELINVPAGNYYSGRYSSIATIDYDYEMMKYPVTNIQYISYLRDAMDLGLVTVNSHSVTGSYSGDEHWPGGLYEFVDFDDPNCRIGFNPPNEFVIKWRWVDGKIEGYDNHPVTEVTWFGANAFATYYNMNLPTKQEWKKLQRLTHLTNSRGGMTWIHLKSILKIVRIFLIMIQLLLGFLMVRIILQTATVRMGYMI